MFSTDLAYIHHAGFSEFAASAAQAVGAVLRAEGIDGGVVVDAGCGSGVLARELGRQGYSVFGFDPSPAMIEIARETAPDAVFEIAALDEAILPRCRAVVATGEVLNYAGLEAALAFVEEAGRAVEPGGLLLFDVAERDSAPAHDEYRTGGEDWSVIVVRESDGARLVMRVLTFREMDGEVRRGEERHELELYDRGQLTAALRDSGFTFRVRRSWGARRLPPGHFACIARRTGDHREESR